MFQRLYLTTVHSHQHDTLASLNVTNLRTTLSNLINIVKPVLNTQQIKGDIKSDHFRKVA